MRSKNYERDIAIARRVLSGDTYAQAAEHHGITAERAQQITKGIIEDALTLAAGNDAFPETIRDVQKMPAISNVRANSHLWNKAIELLADHIQEAAAATPVAGSA
jgi:hypothetical protein